MYRTLRAIIPLSLLLVFFSPASADAEYRDLCISVAGACEWSGPDAPKFDGDVCWDSTGLLTAKGTADCQSGSWPYFLAYGEVIDPLTGEVQAYAPLDDACTASSVCVEGPPPPGAQAEPICCEWGVCVPLDEVPCNSSTSVAYMCSDGVTNQDGSVTCFEGDEF